jgi:hypothetical protein
MMSSSPLQGPENVRGWSLDAQRGRPRRDSIWPLGLLKSADRQESGSAAGYES